MVAHWSWDKEQEKSTKGMGCVWPVVALAERLIALERRMDTSKGSQAAQTFPNPGMYR